MTLAVHYSQRLATEMYCHCQMTVTACFPPLPTDKTVGNSKDTILKTLRTSIYDYDCH